MGKKVKRWPSVAKLEARNLEWCRQRCLAQVGIAESLTIGVMQQLSTDKTICTRGDIALSELRDIDHYLRRVLGRL